MATTPLLTRRRQILARIETTKGSSLHPLAADYGKFLVSEASISFDFGTFSRNFLRETLSPIGVITTTQAATVDFTIEVRRTQLTTTPEAYGVLLRACGFGETTPSSNVLYKPVSDLATMETLSLALNIGGIEHRLVGCVGNVEFAGAVGEVATLAFSFQGAYIGSVERTPLTITHDEGDPLTFQGVDLNYNSQVIATVTAASTASSGGTWTLTVGGQTTSSLAYDISTSALVTAIEALSNVTVGTVTVVASGGADLGDNDAVYTITISGLDSTTAVTANFGSLTGNPHVLDVQTGEEPCVSSIGVNMNNDVQPLQCANSATGIDFFAIVGRNPEITLDPRVVLASEDSRLDFFAQFSEGTTVALDWLNGASGNIEFAVPRAQISGIGDAERNGIYTAEITALCTSLAGDDEFQITLN